MAWFKVDDRLHSHPKARAAGLDALGLWTLAGSYSRAYNLGGAIPAHFVTSFPNGRRIAAKLVAAGLWDTTGDAGWAFHDWADYQPEDDEEARELAREKARERKAASRARNRLQSVTVTRDTPVTRHTNNRDRNVTVTA